jgi:site-specific DNA recombinase
MTISFAFLAPDLLRATVEGRFPRCIGVKRLGDAQQNGALGLDPGKCGARSCRPLLTPWTAPA